MYLFGTRAPLTKIDIKQRLQHECSCANQIKKIMKIDKVLQTSENMLFGEHQVLETESQQEQALADHGFIVATRFFSKANDISSTRCY